MTSNYAPLGGRQETNAAEESYDKDVREAEQHYWEATNWNKFQLIDAMSNEALEVRALRFKDETVKMRQKCKSAISKAKFDKGNRDLGMDSTRWTARRRFLMTAANFWKEITPQQFVICVSCLGTDAEEFLKQMSVKIKPEDWPEWKWLQQWKFEQRGQVYIEPKAFPEDIKIHGWEQAPWKKGKRPNSMKRLIFHLMRAPKVAYEIHWTGAGHIINPESKLDSIFIMRALYDAGSESNVFNTPVGCAILRKSWKHIRAHYWYNVIMDTCFLAILAAVIFYVNHKHQGPPLPLKYAAMVFGVRSVLHPIMEFLALVRIFGVMDGLAAFCSPWSILMTIFDISNAVFILLPLWSNVAGDPCTYENRCHLVEHPVQFSAGVFCKWLHLIVELLCMEAFGKNVLPAIVAMSRPEAFGYMSFLALSVVAACQVYLTYPVHENWTGSAWTGPMKIFRMVLTGDSDTYDLEGVDPIMVGNITHNSFTGKLEQGADNDFFHDGVNVVTIAITTCLTVLLMNVGIGLISQLYTEAKAAAQQLHSHFQAGYIFKILVYQTWCNGMICTKRSFCSKMPCFKDTHDASGCALTPEDKEGFFMGFNPEDVMDQDDQEEMTKDIQEETKNIAATVAELLELSKGTRSVPTETVR